MTRAELGERFGMAGVLGFGETASGLVYAEVTGAAASARVYLQGAHVTAWQPAGERPVLFLSERTELAPGRAIRGGVPLVFPWFGADKKLDRVGGKPGPSHGFARTEMWTMLFAALVPGGAGGDEVQLSFGLGPTAATRALGYDGFRAVYEVRVGRELTLRLTVANEGPAEMEFEEALHTYFAVGDVRDAAVRGLAETGYLDKTEGFAAKAAAGVSLRLTEETDRVYERTAAECVIEDPVWGRRIRIMKTGSETTVVWNPWKGLSDLGTEEWPGMLCVETANASASPVRLAVGEAHAMEVVVSVEARA